MTEKNIFAYRLFLSLNISDFNLFFCENCNPSPEKKSPPLSQQPPLKVEVLSSPPFWKYGWRFNPPAERVKEGGCTLFMRCTTFIVLCYILLLLNIHRIMILLFLINLLGTFLELKDPFNTYVLIQDLRELAPGLKVHFRWFHGLQTILKN